MPKSKEEVPITLVQDKNPARVFLQGRVCNHLVSNFKPFVLKSSCFVQQWLFAHFAPDKTFVGVSEEAVRSILACFHTLLALVKFGGKKKKKKEM